jgi:cytochrome b561
MTTNSPKRYHPLQVTLHWLVVILVFAAFVIGKSMSGQPNDDTKLMPLALHMGIGIVTLLVIVVRFITRMRRLEMQSLIGSANSSIMRCTCLYF